MNVYSAPGLREFRLLLPLDRGMLTVDFTGGRNCGYASRPATFATDDPVTIHLIEKSREFASGRIVRETSDYGCIV